MSKSIKNVTLAFESAKEAKRVLAIVEGRRLAKAGVKRDGRNLIFVLGTEAFRTVVKTMNRRDGILGAKWTSNHNAIVDSR